jgi:hypothetical protein
MACVVLHNFIILEGVPYPNAEVFEDDPEPGDIDYNQLLLEAKADGVLRRDYIAAMLYHDD